MSVGPATARGIVCIGSSAGGLRSLMAIARSLPPTFPCPVLVTQHFPADATSHLPEILARASSLAARQASEEDLLAPHTILTCPSGMKMGVAGDDRIALRPRERGRPDTIDHLFTTAASAGGALVTAVVLSGLGTDGAAGTLVVKEQGGTVLVEDPSTAEWPDMPAATIRAGAVDMILASHDIGPALTRSALAR